MITETVLVVDDEPGVRHALRRLLEMQGLLVREAANVAQMTEQLDAGGIDLVSLDLGLGREDGFALARDLRARRNIPVVIVTGQGDPQDRASGLVAGADDYIVKPFDPREVAIRIRRVLDRYQRGGDRPGTPRVDLEQTAVDLKRGLITHDDGRHEKLTALEAKLLELFMRHPEQVLSRDEISHALHGRDWSPLDRTIDGHVARLRRKIESSGAEAPSRIRSVRGVGYVFTPDNARDLPN